MAGHQLTVWATRLPAQAVEELADGLLEAYEARLRIRRRSIPQGR